MLQQIQSLEELQVNKTISFIRHDLPGLAEGKYKLSLSQNLEGITDNSLAKEYFLAVRADRFRLSDPESMVYSVFPAENASGRYDTVLPSVVFNQSSFPWSRSPLKNSNLADLIAGGENTDTDIPTWLTVILLDEQDVTDYVSDFPGFSLEPQVRTINELFPAVPSMENTISYFHVSGNTLGIGQDGTDCINTLDIPVPLFKKIAPSLEDLNYMAHVRKVSLANKPTLPGVSDKGESEGDFSIVFGNRLPGGNRKTHAYLVSLESMEGFLPPNHPDIPESDNSKMLRLAVLKNWTFYSTSEDNSFADRMKQLNGSKLTEGPASSHITTLKLDVMTGNGHVDAPFTMGFIPLKHHLRSSMKGDNGFISEKTVSWYRGPLASSYVAWLYRIQTPVTSADQATLFDPTTGMFDVSYACAWTLGRLLALRDKGFSSQLYNWRKQLETNLLNSVEQENVQRYFAGVLNQDQAYSIQSKSKDITSKKSGNFTKQVLLSLKNKK